MQNWRMFKAFVIAIVAVTLAFTMSPLVVGSASASATLLDRGMYSVVNVLKLAPMQSRAVKARATCPFSAGGADTNDSGRGDSCMVRVDVNIIVSNPFGSSLAFCVQPPLGAFSPPFEGYSLNSFEKKRKAFARGQACGGNLALAAIPSAADIGAVSSSAELMATWSILVSSSALADAWVVTIENRA
jgi:hypothetical protein